MKRINPTKLMALLASLCLITSSFVGSTLAKYTTSAESTDTARVAKFGVEVTTTVDGAFSTEYNADTTVTDGSGTAIAKTVVSSDSENLVAPGTKGDLASTKIIGKPEVAVNVKKEATLDLTGWEVESAEYCPIIFKVNGTEYMIGATYTTIADLITAVEEAVEADVNYAPNTDLASTDDVTVTWEWPFDGNDVKDTALGNASADDNAAEISFTLKTTVTQIN